MNARVPTTEGFRVDVTAAGIGVPNYPPPAREQIEACKVYLFAHVTPARTYCTATGSYQFKHDAEAWTASAGGPRYLSNGALIVAAYELGLDQRRDGKTQNTELAITIRPAARWLMRARRAAKGWTLHGTEAQCVARARAALERDAKHEARS